MPASLSIYPGTTTKMVCEYNYYHYQQEAPKALLPSQPIYAVDYAAELNDQGNNYLEVGDYDRAMYYYRSALVSVSGGLSSHSSTDFTFNSAYHATYQRPNTKVFRSQHQQQQHRGQPVQYIYSQGLPLIKNQCLSSDAVLKDQELRSSIVVFNLALVIHLKAMKLTSSTTRRPNYILLQKAQSLYRKSCYLLHQWKPIASSVSSPSLQSSTIVDLLYMGCMNNFAEVCFELGDYNESSNLFRQVISYSSRVTHQVDFIAVDNVESQRLKQQAAIFLQNAMVPGMHPPPITAPCA